MSNISAGGHSLKKLFKKFLTQTNEQIGKLGAMMNRIEQMMDSQRAIFCTVDGMENQLTGMDRLREPNVNKELAFTRQEREMFKLTGLLPFNVRSLALQVEIVMANLRLIDDNLAKYIFIRDVQDYNQRLFYRILQVHTKEIMPIVYTPIVGLACQQYSFIYKRPRGLFITKYDSGRIYEILKNYEQPLVKAIVVTDGERILGLGDLGANGMGIPVGKMALYSAIGGIPPDLTLPVTLDVGTNNETLLNDPYYIGIRERRTTGTEYDHLVDEFMEAVVKRWGRYCLIQFEDFGNKNAFRLLKKYQKQYCMFNDDIQGTASVVVAGILAALHKINTNIANSRFLFLGAGEAGLGISSLLIKAMLEEGLDLNTAYSKIWLIDSQGLLTSKRSESEAKKPFLKNVKDSKNLLEIIDIVKPTCLIGVAAVPGAFNQPVLRRMAELNQQPIIFALSNPTTKAECTAQQAYDWTDGRCVFASGSPFDDVTFNGKSYITGQGNNAYIFPGVALAIMASETHLVPDQVFLVAAHALAKQVLPEELAMGSVYPKLDRINEVSLQLATQVTEYLFANGHANYKPEPNDKYRFLQSRLYDPVYDGLEFEKNAIKSHLAWRKEKTT